MNFEEMKKEDDFLGFVVGLGLGLLLLGVAGALGIWMVKVTF